MGLAWMARSKQAVAASTAFHGVMGDTRPCSTLMPICAVSPDLAASCCISSLPATYRWGTST